MATHQTTAREAMLYSKGENQYCDCFLCAHRCHIAPGKRGFCRVRENRDGTLYSLVYGKLIAAHVDPIEKKPFHHFMPGTRSFSIATIGCNFQCDFCQNWQISQAARESTLGPPSYFDPSAPVRAEDIPGDPTTPEQVVAAAQRQRCPSISYTYTEPTIFFEYAHDCAQLAKAEGLRNAFVTNGYATPETVERMAGLIDAANVDLKAYNDEFYRERCKGRLEPVRETIRNMHRAGIHVEVTTLLIPGFNDRPEELTQMADFLASVSPDLPWHLSRYHPDYKFDRAAVTPADTIYRAIEAGKKAGLRYVYAGNLPSGAYDDTHCPRCSNLLIERTGFSARVVGLDGAACRQCGERIPVS